MARYDDSNADTPYANYGEVFQDAPQEPAAPVGNPYEAQIDATMNSGSLPVPLIRWRHGWKN